MSWDISRVPGVLPASMHGLQAVQPTSLPMTPGDGSAAAAAAAAVGGSAPAPTAPALSSLHTGMNSHNHHAQPGAAVAEDMSAPLDADGQNASAAVATLGTSSPIDDEQNGDGESDHDENDMNRDDAEGIWSPDIEQSFQEALAIYPPCGRRKIILSDEGKMYGRNELIARYIKVRTGKMRTRKQVSSHIQVLARKKARELQSRLKEAHSDKEHGVLHSILQTLPGMSSAQIVSTHFDQEEHNGSAGVGTPGPVAPGGIVPTGTGGGAGVAGAAASGSASSGNCLVPMASESFQRNDGTPSQATNSLPLMPRTVGASSAAMATTGSGSVVVKNEPGMAMGNSAAAAALSAGNANAVWPGNSMTAAAAMRGFNDPLAFGGMPAHGMVVGTHPSGPIMAAPPMVGMHHMPLMPRGPVNHVAALPLCSKFTLHEMASFVENRQAEHNDGSSSAPQHCFVHIPPGTDFLETQRPLETIEVHVIWDKFPGLQDLFEKGPQDVFYMVKFWADINAPRVDDIKPYYGVSTTYQSPTSITCRCTTLICSFGSQVVEKVETQHSTVENGAHVVRLNRTPMCEYMVKFIHKLLSLNDRSQMNSVLENFTILQLVVNTHTDELLLCLALMFEVSQEDSELPRTHHVYRLVRTKK